MQLETWLSEEKISRTDFAALVGAHPVSVSKWIAKKMMPRRGHLEAIREVTGGKVTPNDFLCEPSSIQGEAA